MKSGNVINGADQETIRTKAARGQQGIGLRSGSCVILGDTPVYLGRRCGDWCPLPIRSPWRMITRAKRCRHCVLPPRSIGIPVLPMSSPKPPTELAGPHSSAFHCPIRRLDASSSSDIAAVPIKFATPRPKSSGFLSMTRDEMEARGWDVLDVLIITGDAYVAHPSFDAVIIGRVPEAMGLRVGIIAQPDWKNIASIQAIGRSDFRRGELLHYFPGFAANEPLLQELIGMLEYAVKYGHFGSEHDLHWSCRLNPETLSWEGLLKSSGWRGGKKQFGL